MQMSSGKKIFNLSSISIIACECLQAVVCIFVDLFFISRILNNPFASVGSNIINIGLFYIINYTMVGLFYLVSGHLLKRINKSIFVSVGSIILTLVVLIVYLMGDDVLNHIPLLGVIYGLALGFFSAGFHGLTGETISSKHQVRFFAVKKGVYQLTYIIFPVTLGLIIDKLNFSFMLIILLVICVLLVMFSFFIRPKKSFGQTFNLIKFARHLKQNKEETKPLFLVYVSNFFRGASFDCFTTLITIFVMSTFKSNTSLGMFQSIFTACSLLTMVFYLKYYRKKRATKFILPTIILVACTVISILIATNETTIICFYAIYSTLNVILMSISDSRRAGVIRVLSLHSHILESNTFSELFLWLGRIISSSLIILAGFLDSYLSTDMLFLKIVLGIVAIFYIFYGISLIWVEKALIKQDEEFKKVHINEVVEKNED